MSVWEAPRLASEFVYPGYYPRIVISRFKLLAPCVIDARAVSWDRGSERDRGFSYFQRWVRRVRNTIAALRVRPRPLPVSDTIRSAERLLAPTPPKGHGSAPSETDHPCDRWSRRVESNDSREQVSHSEHDETDVNRPETTCEVKETIAGVGNGRFMSMPCARDGPCYTSIRRHPAISRCIICASMITGYSRTCWTILVRRTIFNPSSSGRLSPGFELADRRSLTFKRPRST